MKKSDVGVETIAQFLHVGQNCLGTLTTVNWRQYPCDHPTPPSSRWSDAPPGTPQSSPVCLRKLAWSLIRL
jgi:hypothetical protein